MLQKVSPESLYYDGSVHDAKEPIDALLFALEVCILLLQVFYFMPVELPLHTVELGFADLVVDLMLFLFLSQRNLLILYHSLKHEKVLLGLVIIDVADVLLNEVELA